MIRITFLNLVICFSLVTLAWTYPRQRPEDDSETFPVPDKKAAVFLDRLMAAFRKAMSAEDPDWNTTANHQSDLLHVPEAPSGRVSSSRRSGLERRGQVPNPKTGRVFWRCYFNAVSCF